MSYGAIAFLVIVTLLIFVGIAIAVTHGRGDCDFWDD